jgi:putative SOS response-associated peptidase YedK
MCNDYEQHLKWIEYCELMQRLALGVPAAAGEADLPIADDIRVNDTAPVMRASGNVVALSQMRWSFPPSRPGGKPAFNFRSEGRRFSKEQRVVIPATAFFEFTGTKSPKSKWRFAASNGTPMGIAGIWRRGTSDEPDVFTMLTTAPGADVAPYHDRQIVVLAPQDWASWLYADAPEAELLRPLPEGSLTVTLARPGKEPPETTLRLRAEA